MIIMPIPKDIRAIKAKFIGPFSKRQTLAVIPAGAISIVIFMILGNSVPSDLLTGVIIVVDTPILACGFIDVYGMPLWIFLKDIMVGKFLAPKKRPYSTENTYAEYVKQNCITYEYFDGNDEIYSTEQMRKKENEKKKRLNKFLREHPELKPLE